MRRTHHSVKLRVGSRAGAFRCHMSECLRFNLDLKRLLSGADPTFNRTPGSTARDLECVKTQMRLTSANYLYKFTPLYRVFPGLRWLTRHKLALRSSSFTF